MIETNFRMDAVDVRCDCCGDVMRISRQLFEDQYEKVCDERRLDAATQSRKKGQHAAVGLMLLHCTPDPPVTERAVVRALSDLLGWSCEDEDLCERCMPR